MTDVKTWTASGVLRNSRRQAWDGEFRRLHPKDKSSVGAEGGLQIEEFHVYQCSVD